MKSIVVILLVVLGVFLAGCGVQNFDGGGSPVLNKSGMPQVTCHISSHKTTIKAGDTVMFSAVATGGSGKYETLLFSSGESRELARQLPMNNYANNIGVINYTYTKTGVFTPSVTVTDSYGESSFENCFKITVDSQGMGVNGSVNGTYVKDDEIKDIRVNLSVNGTYVNVSVNSTGGNGSGSNTVRVIGIES